MPQFEHGVGFYDVDLFDCPPFRMFTAGDDPRADNILVDKSFEPESMRLWCEYARSATSILDIGAHVGVYSLAAASLRKDITIHAFEPNPYAFLRLQIHRELNGFDNIVCHPQALAHRAQEAMFSWYVKNPPVISSGGGLGSRGMRSNMGVAQVLVSTARLEDFDIEYGERPLVKIDVEGAERMVLEGAGKLLAAKPDMILESFDQGHCEAITAMLPPGFHVYEIIEAGGVRPVLRLMAADISGSAGYNFNQLITWRCFP